MTSTGEQPVGPAWLRRVSDNNNSRGAMKLMVTSGGEEHEHNNQPNDGDNGDGGRDDGIRTSEDDVSGEFTAKILD